MIYLDNAATSFPKPESVLRAIESLWKDGAGNPGRGGHAFAQRSDAAIREARSAAARLFGAQDPDRVIFTLNATDALNMAIKGILGPGDHAVTSDLEHNSISRPLEALARAGTISLTRVRTDDAGLVDPAVLRNAMTPKTRLVAVAHVSNVLGVAQDVPALAKEAHARNAALLIDAAQSAGVLSIDVEAMGIDLLAFTGHKALLGPMGTGGLVVREGVPLRPWREGGTGGDSSSPVQPTVFPHYLEGGTPNAIGLAGLAAGITYVLERGVEAIREHEVALAKRLASELAKAPRIHIASSPAGDGPPSRGTGRDNEARAELAKREGSDGAGLSQARSVMGLVTFTIEGYDPYEVATILDQSFGIAVRAGLHCAPYIHRRRDLPGGTVRASAGPFTTEAEIDAAAAAILEIASG